MKIRDVAERTGLSAHTIRFYEKVGLLQKINRTEGGIRQFSESDVDFIKFVVGLRKTGMSLEDIAMFIEDGCILERLRTREIPAKSVSVRMEILKKHQQHLIEKRNEIENLMDAVNQKIEFYQEYIERTALQ